eukprot:NODE_275_length_10988_cov_0.409863.p6 type:complete len:233 gc:universal NODE_275_length_10988_cov_0.409863:2326-3024(+)
MAPFENIPNGWENKFETFFVEAYLDQEKCRENTWLKAVQRITNGKQTTEYVTKKAGSDKSKLFVHLQKETIEILAESEFLNSYFHCLVDRIIFENEKYPNVKLQWDLATYPKGDTHTVFSLKSPVGNSAEFLKAKGDFDIKLTRSKAVEYIFRHKKELYDELMLKNILPTIDYTTGSLCTGSVHPRLIEFSKNFCRATMMIMEVDEYKDWTVDEMNHLFEQYDDLKAQNIAD